MTMNEPVHRPSRKHSRDCVTLRSDDGVIAFTLAPNPCGVFVERVQVRPGTACVVQTTVFTDDQSFNRWCDADSTRFNYPVVYVNLKRNGGALFRQRP
jgi:hypothetical protein